MFEELLTMLLCRRRIEWLNAIPQLLSSLISRAVSAKENISKAVFCQSHMTSLLGFVIGYLVVGLNCGCRAYWTGFFQTVESSHLFALNLIDSFKHLIKL